MAFVFASAPAFAQTPLELEARAAYKRGVELHGRGEFAAAARQFALADQLVPRDSVLADAIDESGRANDAAFASMLVARAARNPQAADLQQAASKAKAKFQGRAGRIEPHCPDRCKVEADGKPFDDANEGWLTTGPHVIVLVTDKYPGYRDEHAINVTSIGITTLDFRPPPPLRKEETTHKDDATHKDDTTQKDETAHHGLSPAWFWIGVGATALVAGGAVLSWVDATNKHQDFIDHECDKQGKDDCLQRVDDGKSAVTRTNILLGGAVATGIATAAVGIFFVGWRSHGDDPTSGKPAGSATSAKSPWPKLSVAVGPGESRAVIRGEF